MSKLLGRTLLLTGIMEHYMDFEQRTELSIQKDRESYPMDILFDMCEWGIISLQRMPRPRPLLDRLSPFFCLGGCWVELCLCSLHRRCWTQGPGMDACPLS